MQRRSRAFPEERAPTRAWQAPEVPGSVSANVEIVQTHSSAVAALCFQRFSTVFLQLFDYFCSERGRVGYGRNERSFRWRQRPTLEHRQLRSSPLAMEVSVCRFTPERGSVEYLATCQVSEKFLMCSSIHSRRCGRRAAQCSKHGRGARRVRAGECRVR